jgi:hypothetical protein
MTAEQVLDITTNQNLVNLLVMILDKEVTLSSEARSANGLSNANITNINTTITNALDAINAIIAPAP